MGSPETPLPKIPQNRGRYRFRLRDRGSAPRAATSLTIRISGISPLHLLATKSPSATAAALTERFIAVVIGLSTCSTSHLEGREHRSAHLVQL
jgi:hypothetical protein